MFDNCMLRDFSCIINYKLNCSDITMYCVCDGGVDYAI